MTLSQTWVATISVGNLLDVIFAHYTVRPVRFDYSLFLDMILLCGSIMQRIDVPTQLEKIAEIPEDQLPVYRERINVFLNVVMALLVWLKIGSFVMTTKQFGVYIRMIIMMMLTILNFLIINVAWTLCSALIMYALFHDYSD